MADSNTNVDGVHLVGSVAYPDTETVFRKCCAQLPNRLKRIPDGETGIRNYFTYWQFGVFNAAPQVVKTFVDNKALPSKDFTPAEIEEALAQLASKEIKTGYDDAAIESYAIFKRLKAEGVIPKQTKFQVSLPTGVNTVFIVETAFQARVFPMYEAAMFRAMKRIQAEIPHEELSIQIDLAVDTAHWEGVYEKSWFDNPKEDQLEYITRMVGQVDQDVELGFHNCYGDMEHKHWMEPTSLQAVTDRGRQILARTPHKVSYFHVPVPKSAMSFLPKYFAPLDELYKALESHGSELSLGVVHFDDLEGTKERIAEAKKLAPKFSIATECGWGRTPADQVEGIMAISRELSAPVL